MTAWSVRRGMWSSPARRKRETLAPPPWRTGLATPRPTFVFLRSFIRRRERRVLALVSRQPSVWGTVGSRGSGTRTPLLFLDLRLSHLSRPAPTFPCLHCWSTGWPPCPRCRRGATAASTMQTLCRRWPGKCWWWVMGGWSRSLWSTSSRTSTAKSLGGRAMPCASAPTQGSHASWSRSVNWTGSPLWHVCWSTTRTTWSLCKSPYQSQPLLFEQPPRDPYRNLHAQQPHPFQLLWATRCRALRKPLQLSTLLASS